MVKFSIVTVCFNAKDCIRDTIESVIRQDYDEFEYILVDGGSTDGTKDIIESYAANNDKIKYISEPDNGLYDAMNKGVKMAIGDFAEFLNAGDKLADKNVLSLIAEAISNELSRDLKQRSNMDKYIFYGNIVYQYPDGNEDIRTYGASCGKPIYYATGDCVNHQACFASINCFKEYAFDYKKYRICADRDWMMKQSKAGAKWVSTGKTLIKYDLSDESISVRDKELLKREERMCLKENYPLMLPLYGIFDFCRNNRLLAGILHGLYKMLYIRK